MGKPLLKPRVSLASLSRSVVLARKGLGSGSTDLYQAMHAKQEHSSMGEQPHQHHEPTGSWLLPDSAELEFEWRDDRPRESLPERDESRQPVTTEALTSLLLSASEDVSEIAQRRLDPSVSLRHPAPTTRDSTSGENLHMIIAEWTVGSGDEAEDRQAGFLVEITDSAISLSEDQIATHLVMHGTAPLGVRLVSVFDMTRAESTKVDTRQMSLPERLRRLQSKTDQRLGAGKDSHLT